jgi:MFS family permease
MVAGLFLQTAGFVWVAVRGSLATSWIELDVALLTAGVGVSMALPTVPTAVLNAVAPRELGKASGINYMMQRFGAVFAIAVASAVFAAYGRPGTPAGVTGGFRAALAACAGFALLAASARSPSRRRGRVRSPVPSPSASAIRTAQNGFAAPPDRHAPRPAVSGRSRSPERPPLIVDRQEEQNPPDDPL